MTPAARLQAAIECLDAIVQGAPAEKTLLGWSRGARYAGSKDRAAVRDHVFDALRNRDSYAAWGGALSGRALMLGWARQNAQDLDQLFSGGYGPEPLGAQDSAPPAGDQGEIWNMPQIARQHLTAQFADHAFEIAQALSQRAPVDLRVNTRKATRAAAQEALRESGVDSAQLSASGTALRVRSNARRVKSSQAYCDGLVELQDAGSQALVETLAAQTGLATGARVLDYCAGGGGKSLALGALCDVHLTAHDAHEARMRDLPERAKRAGLTIHCTAQMPRSASASFDLVLCDAPCSGSGAWRRSPDEKWRVSDSSLATVVALQSDILTQAMGFVAPGGYLAYATCSLFSVENHEQIAAFVARQPAFTCVLEHQWTPLDDTDGFYLAILKRN